MILDVQIHQRVACRQHPQLLMITQQVQAREACEAIQRLLLLLFCPVCDRLQLQVLQLD